jgi:(R,R)-butanediol dehydrogenase / meso-butanediol dehydrogenase / diacetyl reductase
MMQVGLVTGQRQVTLQEFPDPVPAPGKAVVQIACCGICGTDVHAYLSGAPYNPAICGHEWCGTVSAAGAGAAVREGDRVAIGIASPCGRCSSCGRGDPDHCEAAFAGLIGAGPLAAPHGGFAPAIAIDAARLYRVDDRLDDAQGAMLEPATIALHAVRRTPLRLGDAVVVLGAGPIGLLVLQCARAAGAGTVVLIEPEPARRALGGTLGADVVIDPHAEDVTERITAHLGYAGADVVFECAGVPATIDAAVSLARRGGAVSLVGVPNGSSQIQGASWLVREIRLVTSLGYHRDEFALTQGLVLDGRLNLHPLHTSTVPLAAIGDAFETLSRSPSEVKILVDPRQ